MSVLDLSFGAFGKKSSRGRVGNIDLIADMIVSDLERRDRRAAWSKLGFAACSMQPVMFRRVVGTTIRRCMSGRGFRLELNLPGLEDATLGSSSFNLTNTSNQSLLRMLAISERRARVG